MSSQNAKVKPSRKSRVHELYNQAGAEQAFTFGRRLHLKDTTLHSWIGSWRREAANSKAEKVRARTEKKRKANVQAAPVEAPVEPASTTTEVQA